MLSFASPFSIDLKQVWIKLKIEFNDAISVLLNHCKSTGKICSTGPMKKFKITQNINQRFR